MKTVTKVALIALLWITIINPANLPPDTDVRLKMPMPCGQELRKFLYPQIIVLPLD